MYSNRTFWDYKWINNNCPWDIKAVSPIIKYWIDIIDDKNKKILIPGCGNSYEAEYLIEKGFEDITLVDISPNLCNKLAIKYKNEDKISVKCEDFFEHIGHYDIILEQTFFCSFDSILRSKYVEKCYNLLQKNGSIYGVLFNRYFDTSPPYGGTLLEYINLFEKYFDIEVCEKCDISIKPRKNSEIKIKFNKI